MRVAAVVVGRRAGIGKLRAAMGKTPADPGGRLALIQPGTEPSTT
ncbi:hypothetical protein PX701_09920 [Agromyces sp. H3Y2-19a]|nr:hypothetical protein [Agromyces chromiiresistens]MDF0513934.1 hypothetical protein [Agromyces chromiiresistens]